MFSIQELRTSTLKELLQELDKARKEFLKIRIHSKTKHDKDKSKVKKTKRYIAQIFTILKEVEKEDLKPQAEVQKPKEIRSQAK